MIYIFGSIKKNKYIKAADEQNPNAQQQRMILRLIFLWDYYCISKIFFFILPKSNIGSQFLSFGYDFPRLLSQKLKNTSDIHIFLYFFWKYSLSIYDIEIVWIR